MKTKIFTIALIILVLLSTTLLLAQEADKKLERKLQKLEHELQEKEFELESIEIPEIHIDMSGLEAAMHNLEFSLQHLEDIEIPEIDIHIPEICFEFDHFDFDFDFENSAFIHNGDWDHSDLFENLSKDEEKKISAVRSMGRQESEKALPALKKILTEESSPAVRYEAVRQLRRFIDEKGIINILARTAKTDQNVEVRKQAIYVLGKSEDPKAVKILKKIVER